MNTKTIKALSVEELENISGGSAEGVVGKILAFAALAAVVVAGGKFCNDVYKEYNGKGLTGYVKDAVNGSDLYKDAVKQTAEWIKKHNK